MEDFKSLYIYSLKEMTFRKIGEKDADLWYYSFVNDSKDLLIQIGKDKNKDGKFDYYREPSTLKLYDYEVDILSDIIGNEIHSVLQEKLEGTIE